MDEDITIMKDWSVLRSDLNLIKQKKKKKKKDFVKRIYTILKTYESSSHLIPIKMVEDFYSSLPLWNEAIIQAQGRYTPYQQW